MSHNDFRDLEVWQKCTELRKTVWALCGEFPQEEKYRLSDQMVRASRSVTACIAEGYGRYHYQETIQFCRQARGSLFEIIDHTVVALECKYISEAEADDLIEGIKKCVWILNGYIKYLKAQKASKR